MNGIYVSWRQRDAVATLDQFLGVVAEFQEKNLDGPQIVFAISRGHCHFLAYGP
jgi:hypothetical protein